MSPIVSQRDRETVRALAEQVAEIAALPVQATKRQLWTRLNRLDPIRPMVWINELPWHELDCDELRPRAEDEIARRVEEKLRNTLYLWRHMPTDMVVDGVYLSPYVYHDSGYALGLDAVRSFDDGLAVSNAADWVPVIKTEADIDQIQTPVITPDWETTERDLERVADLIGDILEVRKQGIAHEWCAPWDVLVERWGIEELYTDMIDRPEFVHRGISRLMDAMISRLDQMEALGLLSVGNNNHRVGSGGLGITDELPSPSFDGRHARPIDQWGTSTGQIFSEVSPAMHEEFCLRYELRWLERFGLNCYGCCEPLHNKIDILRKIPRLRRISMSRWDDIEKAVATIGRDYIFSSKPNPGVFAWDVWEPDEARRDLRDILEKTRGCVVELIMKDVSTCRNDPSRVWDWCRLAVEMAEEYA